MEKHARTVGRRRYAVRRREKKVWRLAVSFAASRSRAASQDCTGGLLKVPPSAVHRYLKYCTVSNGSCVHVMVLMIHTSI